MRDYARPIQIRGMVVAIDPDCRDPHKVLGAVRMIRGVHGVTAVVSIVHAEDPAEVLPPEKLAPRDVLRAVCLHYGVSPDALTSGDRHKSISRARHIAMYLCREFCGLSFPELGRLFGGRDHTTTMGAVRKVQRLVSDDADFNVELDAIERRFPQFGRESA